jgi:chloramphenicol-sensitive protein RarD
MRRGVWLAVGAYAAWGLFPIYWKWLHAVPALQLLGHRMVWSFVLLIGTVLVLGQWRTFRAVAVQPRTLRIYFLAALLIGVNWFVYVWGVNAGHIVETSLGYFINPLLSVLLGVIVLHERLRPLQWIPIGLAAAGVLYLTIVYGAVPWISLILAFSFGLYGLVKKLAPLNALHGLTLETGILFGPMLAYLIAVELNGEGAFLHTGTLPDLLMIGAGVVTVIPLLMFASAARQIPLTLVGILQYIAPTGQFLLGVLIYGESFTTDRLIGFSLVWLALAIFTAENVWQRRRLAAQLSTMHARAAAGE